MRRKIPIPFVAVGLALAWPQWSGAQEQPPSREEMWRIIQLQSSQIADLQDQVERLGGHAETTDQRLESVADAIEERPAQSQERKPRIGGYGELHYNNLTDQHGTRDRDEIDFHRFVGFISHEFSGRTRFFSEIEVEHALSGDDQPGEVELEQAYVEMDLGEEARHRARAGLFLIPVGLLNETHEPPTFYGTERNSVQKNIIPTTWWEGGLALSGHLTDALGYDVAYTSGLAVADDYKIRGGRQKVAKAAASDGAVTGRLRWRRAGLELGSTVHYQTDLTQDGANGAPEPSDGLLLEAHAAYERGRFGLRALYARWMLDADAAEPLGRDVQQGWYVEPSLRVLDNLGLFARYSSWDNEAGDDGDSETQEWAIGLNYWPHDDVVLKLDYQNQSAPSGTTELDGFNVGLGYQF